MTFLLNSFLLAASASTYVMLGVMLVALVFLFIFPMITNRKKGKQVNDMRSTLRIGDEIMTIGGIVGKVVEIHEISLTEKDFVIESGRGDQKSTLSFDMRALHENRTRMKELQEEAAKQAEVQRIQKEQKKNEKNAVSVYNTDEKSKQTSRNDTQNGDNK